MNQIEFIPIEPSVEQQKFINMVNALHEHRDVVYSQGEVATEELMRKFKQDSQSHA